jgi:hypothetical protein
VILSRFCGKCLPDNQQTLSAIIRQFCPEFSARAIVSKGVTSRKGVPSGSKKKSLIIFRPMQWSDHKMREPAKKLFCGSEVLRGRNGVLVKRIWIKYAPEGRNYRQTLEEKYWAWNQGDA